MMEMSWTHSSKAVALGVLLAVALVAVGTAGAVQISGFDEAPTEGEVGEEITVSVELDSLYGEDVPDDQWTLGGETALDNPDWTVIVRDAGGDEIERQDLTQGTFEQDIVRDDNHVSVDVTVTGDVPELTSFDYEDESVEEVLAMELFQVTEDGDRSRLSDATYEIHRYTAESQEARMAIDDAQEAAEEADSDSAQRDIDNAITFYNNGEFESAIDSANDAKDTAEGAQQTRQLMMFGGAAIIVIAILAGGIYYWRQSKQGTSKLQ